MAEAVRAKEGERGAVRFDYCRRGCRADLARLARRAEKLGATGLGQGRRAGRGTWSSSYCCDFVRFILDAGCIWWMGRRFRFVLVRVGVAALYNGRRVLRGTKETNARVAGAVCTANRCLLYRDGPFVIAGWKYFDLLYSDARSFPGRFPA